MSRSVGRPIRSPKSAEMRPEAMKMLQNEPGYFTMSIALEYDPIAKKAA